MRVGIFGGSFDPIHLGHLWIAELSREALSLDEVLFIPTATSPLKPHGPVASSDQRVAMLRLALSGHPSMRIDTREIQRGGASYTIQTIKELRNERPDDQWFLLLGADSINSIDRWKDPSELLSLVLPIVLRRGGDDEPNWTHVANVAGQKRAEEIRAAALDIPMIEISSEELRHRVQSRKSIRYRVPAPVEAFIDAEKIYVATP